MPRAEPVLPRQFLTPCPRQRPFLLMPCSSIYYRSQGKKLCRVRTVGPLNPRPTSPNGRLCWGLSHSLNGQSITSEELPGDQGLGRILRFREARRPGLGAELDGAKGDTW